MLSLFICPCCSLQPMDLHVGEETPPKVPHAHHMCGSPLVSPWTDSPLSRCGLLTVSHRQVAIIEPRLRLPWHGVTAGKAKPGAHDPVAANLKISLIFHMLKS